MNRRWSDGHGLRIARKEQLPGYSFDRPADPGTPATLPTPEHQRPDGFVDPDDTLLAKARDGIEALKWQHVTGKRPVNQIDED